MPIYTPDVPQPNQTIAASQPIINADFTYLAGTATAGLLRDHNMTLDTSNASDGTHLQVTFTTPLSTFPAITGAVSALYVKTVNGAPELFYYDGTTEIQLTAKNQLQVFCVTGSLSVGPAAFAAIPNLPSQLISGRFTMLRSDSGFFHGSFANFTGLTPKIISTASFTTSSGMEWNAGSLQIYNNSGTYTYHYVIFYQITA